MTNDDLLRQIKNIVHDEVQSTEIRLNSRIDTLEQKIDRAQLTLDTKIDKVQESVDIVQEVMVKHHGMLIARVEALEEKAGTTPQKH